MRAIPQELIFALVFGAALLVQFLYKRLRTPPALTNAEVKPNPDVEIETEADAEAEAEGEPPTALFPLTAARRRAEADPTDAPRVIESPRSAPPTTAPRTWRRSRRFSRVALLRDRRAVQDAVVIAAILRPCHAHRPHHVD